MKIILWNERIYDLPEIIGDKICNQVKWARSIDGKETDEKLISLVLLNNSTCELIKNIVKDLEWKLNVRYSSYENDPEYRSIAVNGKKEAERELNQIIRFVKDLIHFSANITCEDETIDQMLEYINNEIYIYKSVDGSNYTIMRNMNATDRKQLKRVEV